MMIKVVIFTILSRFFDPNYDAKRMLNYWNITTRPNDDQIRVKTCTRLGDPREYCVITMIGIYT